MAQSLFGQRSHGFQVGLDGHIRGTSPQAYMRIIARLSVYTRTMLHIALAAAHGVLLAVMTGRATATSGPLRSMCRPAPLMASAPSDGS